MRSADEFVMFCDPAAACSDGYVQLLLNVTCGRAPNEIPEHLHDMSGYGIFVRLPIFLNTFFLDLLVVME